MSARKATWAIYGAAAITVIALAAIGCAHGWAFERELFWLRASGWSALIALLLALCATPAGKLAARVRPGRPRVNVAPARRALGISAAALATVHGALALSTYLAHSLAHVLDIAWVRGGLVAWAVLLALWITSYPRVVRALRVRAWKPLHRLAYAAALFSLQHVLLAPLAPRGWVLAAFGSALALAMLRLIPQRKSTPSQASSQAQT